MKIKFIQKIIDKLRKKDKSKAKKYVFNKPTNSILLSNFSIRGEYEGKVEIGNDSMLNCNLIFEGSKGNIKIGDRTFINGGTQLISQESIEIGNDVTIAWGCTIYDHNSHSIDWIERANDIKQQTIDYKNGDDFIKNKNWDVVKKRPIKICDKAWLGFDVTVLNGVTIGEGAIIGAKSVVRNDVEPWSIYAGNPAVKIKDIKH